MSALDKIAIEMMTLQKFAEFEGNTLDIAALVMERVGHGKEEDALETISFAIKSFAEASVLTGASWVCRISPGIESKDDALKFLVSKKKDMSNFADIFSLMLSNLLLASSVDHPKMTLVGQETASQKSERLSEMCQEFLDQYQKEFMAAK